MQLRYHIQFSNRRTSFMLDKILSDMLAIQLGVAPDDPAAHTAVREWLETEIIDKLGDNLPTGSRVSQWARFYVIRAIAAPGINDAYTALSLERDTNR